MIRKRVLLRWRNRLRVGLLVGTAIFIVLQIVALFPATLEESNQSAILEPKTLIPEEKTHLATGIPVGVIPEYTVDKFDYISTAAQEKQWKLNADHASVYHKQNIVHAFDIKALIYDPDGKVTEVTGKEAKYQLNHQDLEVFGDVVTHFADGFELRSEYLRYLPKEKKIQIPPPYLVHGFSHETTGQNMSFQSFGLDFEMARSEIVLPVAPRVTVTPIPPPPSAAPTPASDAPADYTRIDSDRAVIDRKIQMVYFTMDQHRALESRFVHVNQPKLFAQGRRGQLNYGAQASQLQDLSLFDDVLVRDLGIKDSIRYGTGGKADFDEKRNVIILSEFPQVYQDQDTVTGDTILMHRDTDVVEVQNSNSFSTGQNQP